MVNGWKMVGRFATNLFNVSIKCDQRRTACDVTRRVGVIQRQALPTGRKLLTIHIQPATGLAHKATAFVNTLRRGAADAKARDEFHLGMVCIPITRTDYLETQPLGARLEGH
jgi:hypothetical protein